MVVRWEMSSNLCYHLYCVLISTDYYISDMAPVKAVETGAKIIVIYTAVIVCYYKFWADMLVLLQKRLNLKVLLVQPFLFTIIIKYELLYTFADTPLWSNKPHRSIHWKDKYTKIFLLFIIVSSLCHILKQQISHNTT